MKKIDIAIAIALLSIALTGISSSLEYNNPRTLAAVLSPFSASPENSQPPPFTPPTLKTDAHAPVLAAPAFIVIDESPDGREFILHTHAAYDQYPIASLTKLMTSIIASEHFSASREFTITKDTIAKNGATKKFPLETVVSTDTLLKTLLVESNNDSARALALEYGYDAFLHLMNERAHMLGLQDTWYGDPAGLDPDDNSPPNHSSAYDTARLLTYLYTSHPQLFDILKIQLYPVTDIHRNRLYIAETTNKLLDDSEIPLSIIGGKTGSTPLAKKNLAVITSIPNNNGFLVFVVLDSDDHFNDVKKLIQWTFESFDWR